MDTNKFIDKFKMDRVESVIIKTNLMKIELYPTEGNIQFCSAAPTAIFDEYERCVSVRQDEPTTVVMSMKLEKGLIVDNFSHDIMVFKNTEWDWFRVEEKK